MNQTLPRIYAFDVLKFIGALGIATLHFNWKLIPQGYLFVELFFMISGFFLYFHLPLYKEISLLDIFIKRLNSFYFYYVLALILKITCSSEVPSLFQIINALFFLGDIGLGERWMYGSLWFLGVYLFCYSAYAYMYSSMYKKTALFITVVIVFISLFSVYTYSPAHALNKTYEMTIGPFQFGLLRGIIGIGLGIVLGAIVQSFQTIKSFKLIYIEILSVILILYYLFLPATPKYDFINYIVLSFIISPIYLYNNSFNKHLEFIGEKCKSICSLSLPIYIFHSFVIEILKYFNYTASNTPPCIYLAVIVIFAIFIKFMHSLFIKIIKMFNGVNL